MERTEVIKDGIYQHFKTMEVYRVIGIAKPDPNVVERTEWQNVFKVTHTESEHDIVIYVVDDELYYEGEIGGENLVLYYNIGEENTPVIIFKVWARPEPMFTGIVDFSVSVTIGENREPTTLDTQVPRFKLLFPLEGGN